LGKDRPRAQQQAVRLEFSRTAQRHLREARDFIARDNPDAAEALVALIASRATTLQQFPLAGRLLSGDRRALALPPTPYSLIYRSLPERVIVLAVWHGARAWR
jgi:plasmid stabilization system protein ParE